MNKLPWKIIITDDIQKLLLDAQSKISELNGLYLMIPNQNIILNALTLTEAKESSAIENIFTTYDELYKEMANISENNPAAKEVVRYRTSLLTAFKEIVNTNKLNLSIINKVHDLIHPDHKGVRQYDGKNKVVIKNIRTDEIIYTPPQEKKEILMCLDNLFHYI
jgi:Fic family protein